MFDGSSIAGWKSIDQSDKISPDCSSSYVDPFMQKKHYAIVMLPNLCWRTL